MSGRFNDVATNGLAARTSIYRISIYSASRIYGLRRDKHAYVDDCVAFALAILPAIYAIAFVAASVALVVAVPRDHRKRE
jgi:hypothetical protein